jgi:hypothetical protein
MASSVRLLAEKPVERFAVFNDFVGKNNIDTFSFQPLELRRNENRRIVRTNFKQC